MQGSSLSEVYYRPIDAAIRWAGLFRFKDDILAAARFGRLPARLECPRCNELRLCTDVSVLPDHLADRRIKRSKF